MHSERSVGCGRVAAAQQRSVRTWSTPNAVLPSLPSLCLVGASRKITTAEGKPAYLSSQVLAGLLLAAIVLCSPFPILSLYSFLVPCYHSGLAFFHNFLPYNLINKNVAVI